MMSTLTSRLRAAALVAAAGFAAPTLAMALTSTSSGTLDPAAPAGAALAPQLGTGATGSTATTTTTTTSAGTTSSGGNLPADKVTVAASKIDEFSPNADITLLSAQMRTSNPADLTFSVSLECSIITSVTTMGNDSQSAFGEVKVWVEIDGRNVGVLPATQGQSDDGKVVFCNRTYSSTTNGFSEAGNSGNQDPTITTFENTKAANAFNWVALNVGNGIHTISIHATLSQQVTDSTKDMAKAVVGNRTVVVDTTETAQNMAG
jgi:hypothetical protein